MKRALLYLAAVSSFALLTAFPDSASGGVKYGLGLCAGLIVPSLFPFFVAVGLLSELGALKSLGNMLAPLFSRLFGVSGTGGTAFFIGVTGGYPLGASYISGLYEKGGISRDEAQFLLCFCNNSGPAFIVGAVGVGVFSSSAAGLFLYAVHIASAMIYGIVFSKHGYASSPDHGDTEVSGFSAAFTASVKNAVSSCLSICGFVTAFSVVNFVLEDMLVFSRLSGLISDCLGTELHWSRALISGFLELGNGIGSMSDPGLTPINLALAAFLLGWGGISVHFQSFSVTQGLNVKTARYMFGRFFIALTGAALALLGGALLF